MTWYKTSERLPDERLVVVVWDHEGVMGAPLTGYVESNCWTVSEEQSHNLNAYSFWHPIPLSKCCGWPYSQKLSGTFNHEGDMIPDKPTCYKCSKLCEVSE